MKINQLYGKYVGLKGLATVASNRYAAAIDKGLLVPFADLRRLERQKLRAIKAQDLAWNQLYQAVEADKNWSWIHGRPVRRVAQGSSGRGKK